MKRFNKIFEDKGSKSLRKQIQEVSSYIHKEIDKSVTKQLLLRILERNLLPILTYPVRESSMILPMSYSQKIDHQVNIHTPIPKLLLMSEEDYVNQPEKSNEEHDDNRRIEFRILIKEMKERVEKLE